MDSFYGVNYGEINKGGAHEDSKKTETIFSGI